MSFLYLTGTTYEANNTNPFEVLVLLVRYLLTLFFIGVYVSDVVIYVRIASYATVPYNLNFIFGFHLQNTLRKYDL